MNIPRVNSGAHWYNTDEGEDQSIGVKLLADIRAVFAGRSDDRITSLGLATELHVMEDRPWPEYGRARKPISVNQIARLLKPFAIVPRKIWIGGESVRGYPIASFNDAFARYLLSQGGRVEGTAEFRGLQPDSEPEGNGEPSTLENTGNPRGTAETGDLPPWNGESTDAHAVEPESPPSKAAWDI